MTPSQHDNGRLNGQPPVDDDGDVVKALLREARHTKPLQPGEQDRLLERAGLGDDASRERLVETHLELVIRLAAKRGEQGLPLGDLVQEGSLGLVEAIRGYTAHEGGLDFEAFATERINAQLDAALAAEAEALREAESMVTAATDYERVELLLTREFHRRPTENELAEKLEWTVDRLRIVAEQVELARRRHDEELIAFIDPDVADVEEAIDKRIDELDG